MSERATQTTPGRSTEAGLAIGSPPASCSRSWAPRPWCFWIGIPVGGLWLFSKVTDSWNGHFLLSLVLIPAAMALFAPALFWLNGLYLRTIGVLRPGDEDEERQLAPRADRSSCSSTVGMVIAVVALFAWFFFLARYPPEIVW